MKLLVLALVLAAGARPFSAQIGSVVREHKLNEVSGGLVGPLPPGLGFALDANRDGRAKACSGAPGTTLSNALYLQVGN
jgi:hypothetical protein